MKTVKDILSKINYIKFIGDVNCEIHSVIQLDKYNSNPNVIYWCNDKNSSILNHCKFGTIICSSKIISGIKIHTSCNYIIVDNPRLIFASIVRDFFVIETKHTGISKNAVIHPSVKIGNNVTIGDFTIIEQGCDLGDDIFIGYNNAILQNTIIKSHVHIGSNNTIGGVGFGYEKNEDGDYEFLPHIGNVIICDFVEIGNNNCVDRAVLGSTILNKNVKVDNLVHIAHGVEIGENSLIIANSMIGGSSKIGKNVWVAPSASIINNVEIHDNALIGMGAVVIKSVDEYNVVAGNPSKFIKKLK
jgi:UDP-3-O-[3-hydroxymyristoyl] glucosamine N-acyltransferase